MGKKNIYYIGSRTSDIATTFDANTTDDFFKGSITCYGDNKNGNTAYNVISGIQLCDDDSRYGARNKAIYKKFIGEQCQNIVASDPKALFLPYSVYFAKMVPQELRDRVICCNDLRVLKYLNSKFNFKKLIDGKITQAPYEFLPGTEIIKRIEKGNIPNTKEVVIQAEYCAGGEGTFIATHRNFENPKFKQQLIDMIIPNEIYVVSDFINTFCSVSVHILVSDDEIGVYPPGTMIMKGPSYAGSDLFKYSQLDDGIKQECEQAAIGFGKILQNLDNVKIDGKVLTKIKVRGFFGIDLIVAKDKTPPRVFAVETNARFTGSTGLLNILCHKAKIGSVFEHTYRCFKGEPTNFTHDFAKIKPNGKKRFAEVECVGGHVKSRENGNHNMEGLNETVWQEDGIYTYSVFEEVRNFNARDDRKRYKKFLSKGTFSKRRQ